MTPFSQVIAETRSKRILAQMTALALVPQPAPKPPSVPDDLWLMVCLWQRPHTREVALDLADANRRARNAAADAFMDAHLGKDAR